MKFCHADCIENCLQFMYYPARLGHTNTHMLYRPATTSAVRFGDCLAYVQSLLVLYSMQTNASC